MKIIELLKNLKVQSIQGDLEIEINQIQYHYEKVFSNYRSIKRCFCNLSFSMQ